jgi:hypothetical protein
MLEDLRKAANVEIERLMHRQDEAFYSRMRRNRALGLWAGSQLILRARSWDFASHIVDLGVSEPDDNKFVKLVQKEFARRGLKIPETAIYSELLRQASSAARPRQPGSSSC